MAAYPKKAKVPVSRHPAFPLVVALWFAALLSLGSLAVRATALERIVLATHIDLIVPAAAPPLGFTARLCLALGLFVIGATIGFMLGRAIARAGQPAAPSHRFAEVRRAPAPAVDDNEDLQRLDSAREAPIAGRRRALAMTEDVAPVYHDTVPTPGGAPEILDLSVLDAIAEQVTEPAPAHATPEPEEAYDDYEEVEAEEPAPPHRAFDAPVETPVIEAIARVVSEPLPGTRPFAPPASEPVGLGLIPRDAAQKLRTAPIGTLGVVELAERLAMAIARRKAEAGHPVEVEVSAPVAVAEAPPAPEPEAPAQIFDRLLGAAPEAAPEPEDEPAPAPAVLPAAMRPLSFDDFDDEPEEPALPPRRFAMPSQSAPANDEPELVPDVAVATDEAEDESYGSLLEMKTPQRPAFVRIEEPVEEVAEVEPVVIFPGQAAAESPAVRRFDAPAAMVSPPRVAAGQARPADPEETERALKAALATLQRMSGAA